ncbi:FadR/GntR family transcriptional regulator [Saccharopolyspora griseoalba]|uniref:FadR/GntR family transcriptional regulator n=1 Tax=Saccharopolyspora griseoalba TaxID=1431848 RepID=A0ABW2LFX6_9PSEU
MALRVIDWTALAADARSGPAGLAALISGLLVRGELRAGDRLPSERDFAELLGTSRATVREAIHELELKGVVDRRRGRGTVITPDAGATGLLGAQETELGELHDVQDLRATVEPAIASRAALRATRADVELLRDIVDEAEGRTGRRAAELDERFHAGVARAARNPLLAGLVTASAERIREARGRAHRKVATRRRSQAGHRDVLQAIEQGDHDAAADAMSAHLRYAATRLA